MGRAPCCDKANVKKGPWSPEEDTKLKAYIEQYGTGGNWIALPQKIGLKRCGKSCRLRWLNYLRPNLKHGGFSYEEDNIICSLYISIGSRWSIIAAQLPGRTDNDIKNYWNTRLKKKLLGRRKQSNTDRLSSMSDKDPKDPNDGEYSSISQALGNLALERLQLHVQLQTPISFYNNPALWPKSHPFQEMMTQSLQSLNDNALPGLQPGYGQKVNFSDPQSAPIPTQQGFRKMGNPKLDELMENSLSGTNLLNSSIVKGDGVEQSNAAIQPVSAFQNEFEEFLNYRSAGLILQEDQLAEFDCFKEMNGSKDSLIWWSNNEFDTKSASSNTWDSTSVLQTEGMFQDYGLRYNLK